MDYKEKIFLNLNNNNNLSIQPTYLKEDTWFKHIRHSNSLCVHITRAITNHTLISEYHLRFFPKELFQEITSYINVDYKRTSFSELFLFHIFWLIYVL